MNKMHMNIISIKTILILTTNIILMILVSSADHIELK